MKARADGTDTLLDYLTVYEIDSTPARKGFRQTSYKPCGVKPLEIVCYSPLFKVGCWCLHVSLCGGRGLAMLRPSSIADRLNEDIEIENV